MVSLLDVKKKDNVVTQTRAIELGWNQRWRRTGGSGTQDGPVWVSLHRTGWKDRGWPGLRGPGAFWKTKLHLKARIARPRTTCAPLAPCPQRPALTCAEQTLEEGL